MGNRDARAAAPRPSASVYEVEDQWAAALVRGGRVDFFGSSLVIPAERRFGDIASVQRYVDGVLALPSVTAKYPGIDSVEVRERRGQSKAHYEPDIAVIAVPVIETWALRESVVLHEIAHHLMCSSSAGRTIDWHGVGFRSTMCSLVAIVLGDEAALLLRTGYEAAGLSSVDAS